MYIAQFMSEFLMSYLSAYSYLYKDHLVFYLVAIFGS